MSVVQSVYETDTGCPGTIRNTTPMDSRNDRGTFSAECELCGAVFGGLRIYAPTPKNVALGVALAGSTHDKYAASNALANIGWWIPPRRWRPRRWQVSTQAGGKDNEYAAIPLRGLRTLSELS